MIIKRFMQHNGRSDANLILKEGWNMVFYWQTIDGVINSHRG